MSVTVLQCAYGYDGINPNVSRVGHLTPISLVSFPLFHTVSFSFSYSLSLVVTVQLSLPSSLVADADDAEPVALAD